jgi:hypothetical protein
MLITRKSRSSPEQKQVFSGNRTLPEQTPGWLNAENGGMQTYLKLD